MNLFSNCNLKELSNKLSWINEPEEWSFANEILTIKVPESADFFKDPSGISVRSSAPFLYTNIKSDFSLTARVEVNMISAYDSGCLMIMDDDKNWGKICFEYVNNTPTIVSVVTKDVSDDCVSQNVDIIKPYLKISKSGNCVAFHYSLNNINWVLVRYFYMKDTNELKVGVVGQCPTGKGSTVKFNFLELKIESMKDVRIID